MPYYVCVKKTAEGKPQIRLVEVGKYVHDLHGDRWAGVEEIGPALNTPEHGSIRIMRDGNLRFCKVLDKHTSVSAQIILHSGDRPAFIAGREDFLELTEIIR